MKKQVNPEIFNILKSLVDKRTPVLNIQLQQGINARSKIANLQSQIASSQQYISNNRYDRAEVLETEEEIAQYEKEINVLKGSASITDWARTELEETKKFYKTYNSIGKESKISVLNNEYEKLDERVDVLDELMFACEANMDKYERSPDVYNQAQQDFDKYHEEYKNIIHRMDCVLKEIMVLSK